MITFFCFQKSRVLNSYLNFSIIGTKMVEDEEIVEKDGSEQWTEFRKFARNWWAVGGWDKQPIYTYTLSLVYVLKQKNKLQLEANNVLLHSLSK